jgi:cellulose synthase/poly-beta-1,6-N-acetylglucosamine synthase-like glycosyltransferase
MAMTLMFTFLYFYQVIYVAVAFYFKWKKREEVRPEKLHRFAVIIAARNEAAVIGELIKSVKKQNYPSELLDIFVVADNCTDNTAKVAKDAGALVFERKNKKLVGKGYALNFIFKIIEQKYAFKNYEGYFVFDADNLLDENYVYEMNKLFDKGYRVLTSYRNSKNYDSNWISAGYSLWFLREAEYLNNPRMCLSTSCAISGTGFLVSQEIIREAGGWHYHLLTEDIEFSVDHVIRGEVIGYCKNAILYDEQPCSFEQSWHQRLRWSKGFYQVFGKYGGELFKSMFKKERNKFSSYDMLMTILPSVFFSILGIFINSWVLFAAILNTRPMTRVIDVSSAAILWSFGNFYLVMFVLGLITTITEWKKISCRPAKKILYTFTFPVFIFTYIPIAIVALFKKVEWKPITHGIVKTLEQVR